MTGTPSLVAEGPLRETPAGPADPWLDGLLRRCRFPDPGAGPCVMAVSGGPDSMALMILARRAGLAGSAVHVDHGMRPGSAAEASVVAAAAEALGFAFRSERVAVADGPDLEARARRARYAVLPAGVLTGHTMDDQAETVLLNLMRGGGLDGMAGMRDGVAPPGEAPWSDPALPAGGAQWPVGDWPIWRAGARRVARPLLGLRRSDTAEVCRIAGVAPIVDPSNADPRFRRNRVRSELLPLMSGIAERDIVPVLARQAALLADDAAFLEGLAYGLDPSDVRVLRSAAPVLARRALRRWLRSGEELHPPSAAELARVMDVVYGRATACELSGGRRVARSRGRLSVSDPASRPAGAGAARTGTEAKGRK